MTSGHLRSGNWLPLSDSYVIFEFFLGVFLVCDFIPPVTESVPSSYSTSVQSLCHAQRQRLAVLLLVPESLYDV
jgi:hypothetical protein